MGIGWTFVIGFAVLFLLQAVPSIGFVLALRRRGRGRLADAECPKAAVVLCLRGDDPFLKDCLTGLFSQDYPNYDVRIVVDQREDPAWQVVQETIEQLQSTHVVVEPLTQRLETCSLKGSSIVQAVSKLDDSYGAVAFLDADTLPHPTWLRELIAPLVDERVGVSSGNRWYMPTIATWGALVRYIWNAAGVVQMYWNHFTWGGSVALRATLACHSDLIEKWQTAVSTDTVILDVARRHGLRTEFVPSLMMTNRESCDLGGFFRWVQRQMIVARLYHRGWLPIVLHGFLMTLIPLLALAILTITLFTARWEASILVGASLLAYWMAMGLLVVLLESNVRRIVRARGEPTGWFTPRIAGKFFFALPVTQAVYAAALLKASCMQTVNWRGVSYRVEGPRRVRMIEYRPYQAEAHPTDSVASL